MSEPRALAFLRGLWAVDQALHVASKRMAARFGVTGPQRLVIRLTGRHPSITAGELARRMHLHPSTVTDILGRLERAGLVRRRADARDRRQIRIELTSAGRRIDARTSGTIEAAIARALARTSAADLEAAGRLHDAVISALNGRSGHAVPKRRPPTR